MAKVVHGELKFKNRNMAQISDFMSILVVNGFTVEITPKNDEIIITIMTEAD